MLRTDHREDLNMELKRIKGYPAGIYLLKANNRNIRARCEICSKLTIKIPERRLVTLNIFHTLL